MTDKKVCLNCGKELSYFKYFCDIECELEHTEVLNKQDNLDR
jgi:hypothetical protein